MMRKNLSAAPIEQRRPGEAQRLPGCPGEGRLRHQELPCAAGLPGLAFPNEEFPPHRNPPSIAGRAWSAELPGAAFGRCSPPCLTAGRPFGYRPAAPGSAL